MKLMLDTRDLATAARLVASRLPTRPPVPAMAGIQLTAAGDQIHLAAGDFETTARAQVPGAVREPGTALLPGRLLADLARTLPADDPVDLTVQEGIAHLQAGSTRVRIPVLNGEDYPSAPQLAKACGQLPGSDMHQAITQVATAAAPDDYGLPVLAGVRFDLSGRYLRLVATDRYRIAVRKLRLPRTGRTPATTSVLIPAKELKQTAKGLRYAERVGIGFPAGAEQPLTLTADDRTFTHRPIEGDLPSFDRLFPPRFATTVVLDSKPLLQMLARAEKVLERNIPVRLHVDPGRRMLTLRGGFPELADIPQITDQMPARRISGPEMTVAFNRIFLKDGVTTVGTRQIQLNFTTPTQPALLHAPRARAGDLRYLLMPTRLHGDN